MLLVFVEDINIVYDIHNIIVHVASFVNILFTILCIVTRDSQPHVEKRNPKEPKVALGYFMVRLHRDLHARDLRL